MMPIFFTGVNNYVEKLSELSRFGVGTVYDNSISRKACRSNHSTWRMIWLLYEIDMNIGWLNTVICRIMPGKL
jgi:hypothetical protein